MSVFKQLVDLNTAIGGSQEVSDPTSQASLANIDANTADNATQTTLAAIDSKLAGTLTVSDSTAQSTLTQIEANTSEQSGVKITRYLEIQGNDLFNISVNTQETALAVRARQISQQLRTAPMNGFKNALLGGGNFQTVGDAWASGDKQHVSILGDVGWTIVSTNNNDMTGSSGALVVRVTGLNDTENIVSADVAMNGITPVVSVITCMCIIGFEVLTAGATRSNEGDIAVHVDGIVFQVGSRIGALNSVADVGLFAPSNFSGGVGGPYYMQSLVGTCSDSCRLQIRVYTFTGGVVVLEQILFKATVNGSFDLNLVSIPLFFRGKIIRVVAKAMVGDADLMFHFNGWSTT